MQPVARRDDLVEAMDTHTVLSPAPAPAPLPFRGVLVQRLSPDVLVNGRPAAVVDSIAQNTPPHVPPPGTSFARPPANLGRVAGGAPQVLVGGRPLARLGDPVETCNDPLDVPVGRITSGSGDVLA